MDLGQIIHDETEAAIRHECGATGRIKKPALISFFLQHEHLKVLRTNLRLQIFGSEMRFGAKMDKARVIKIIKAGVDVFLHAALEQAILTHQSPAERKRREDKAGAEQRAAEWYAEEQRVLADTSISASTYIPDAKEDIQEAAKEAPEAAT